MTDQQSNQAEVAEEELGGEIVENESLRVEDEFPQAVIVMKGLNIVKVGLSTSRKLSDDIYGTFSKNLYLEASVTKKDDPVEILEKLSEKEEEWIGRSVFVWAQDAEERKNAETIHRDAQNTGNQGFTAPASSPVVYTPTQNPVSAPAVPVQNATDEVIFVNTLRVWNMPNGGQGVKVMGGPYTQYGVTVYPEVYHTLGFHATGLEPNDYQMGGFQNLQAVILKKTITDQATNQPKVVPDKVSHFINNGVALPVQREG